MADATRTRACAPCVNGSLPAQLVVRDCAEGVVLLGDYRRVLHANAATATGRRLIVTAYCGKSLVDLVHGEAA